MERTLHQQNEQWHLDRKVPISIITAIVLQTVGFVAIGAAWKTDIDSRLVSLEKAEDGKSSHETRITILEQQFSYIRADLAEIKDILRRTVPSPGN
jgi:hypothetical protein